MVGHDHVRMEQKSALFAVVKQRALQQLCGCRNLKQPPSLCRDGCDEIGSYFLGCPMHMASITEVPAAEAA